MSKKFSINKNIIVTLFFSIVCSSAFGMNKQGNINTVSFNTEEYSALPASLQQGSAGQETTRATLPEAIPQNSGDSSQLSIDVDNTSNEEMVTPPSSPDSSSLHASPPPLSSLTTLAANMISTLDIKTANTHDNESGDNQPAKHFRPESGQPKSVKPTDNTIVYEEVEIDDHSKQLNDKKDTKGSSSLSLPSVTAPATSITSILDVKTDKKVKGKSKEKKQTTYARKTSPVNSRMLTNAKDNAVQQALLDAINHKQYRALYFAILRKNADLKAIENLENNALSSLQNKINRVTHNACLYYINLALLELQRTSTTKKPFNECKNPKCSLLEHIINLQTPATTKKHPITNRVLPSKKYSMQQLNNNWAGCSDIRLHTLHHKDIPTVLMKLYNSRDKSLKLARAKLAYMIKVAEINRLAQIRANDQKQVDTPRTPNQTSAQENIARIIKGVTSKVPTQSEIGGQEASIRKLKSDFDDFTLVIKKLTNIESATADKKISSSPTSSTKRQKTETTGYVPLSHKLPTILEHKQTSQSKSDTKKRKADLISRSDADVTIVVDEVVFDDSEGTSDVKTQAATQLNLDATDKKNQKSTDIKTSSSTASDKTDDKQKADKPSSASDQKTWSSCDNPKCRVTKLIIRLQTATRKFKHPSVLSLLQELHKEVALKCSNQYKHHFDGQNPVTILENLRESKLDTLEATRVELGKIPNNSRNKKALEAVKKRVEELEKEVAFLIEYILNSKYYIGNKGHE